MSKLQIQPPREAIGRDAEGRPVYVTPSWYRYLMVDLFNRVGGTTAPSNNELDQFAQYDIREADTAELSKRVEVLAVDIAMLPDHTAAIARINALILDLQFLVDSFSPTPDAETAKRIDSLETLQAFT